jgi:hypothetical protein
VRFFALRKTLIGVLFVQKKCDLSTCDFGAATNRARQLFPARLSPSHPLRRTTFALPLHHRTSNQTTVLQIKNGRTSRQNRANFKSKSHRTSNQTTVLQIKAERTSNQKVAYLNSTTNELQRKNYRTSNQGSLHKILCSQRLMSNPGC